MPRRLSKRVLVEHTSGARKEVLRSQMSTLGPHWKRVTRKKPPSESPTEPSQANVEPAEAPEANNKE